MTKYATIASKIIKEQELIIGPVAWTQANLVSGLQIIDKEQGNVDIAADIDGKEVLNQLVAKYELLFGKAAKEVCKDSIIALLVDLDPSEIPSSLK